MSQANNLKILKFIVSKGDGGCTELNFIKFDETSDPELPYHPILLELIQTGKIEHDEVNHTYYVTQEGRKYMEQIERIEAAEND